MSRIVWIALVVAWVGCKYPDPGGGDDGGPSITTDIVVHQTASSTKLYLVGRPWFGALETLPVAEEYTGHARVFTLLGFVFVATTDGKLHKLDHDGVGGLTDVGQTLDFGPLGITRFEDSWVVIDTKAWYFDSVGDRAFFVDLDTMTILETISLAAADVPGKNVVWTGAAQLDDKTGNSHIYVSLYYEDPANPLVHETQLTVLWIGPTRTLQPLLHDSRCIRAQMIGVAPNGTVLIVGDSSYYVQFGMPSAAPENRLVRIESSDPGIIDGDPSSSWLIDNYMSMDKSGSYAFARTSDIAMMWARENAVYTTLAEYQSMSRWRPHTLSLENLEGAMISDDVVNIGKPGRTFVLGETAYFVVNRRDDSLPGGAIRTNLGGGDFDEIVTFPPGDITLLARID